MPSINVIRNQQEIDQLRTLQNGSVPPPFLSFNSSSTLQALEEVKSFEPSRPKLAMPNYQKLACQMVKDLEKSGEKHAQVTDKETKFSRDTMETQDALKQKAFLENAQAFANQETWGALSKASTYFLSLSSLACASLLAPSVAASLFLISAGVGLGRQVVTDTIGWETVASYFVESIEDQKALVQKIEWGLFMVDMGTKLAAGCVGMQDVMLHGDQILGALQQNIEWGGSLIKGASSFSASFYQKKIDELQHQIKRLEQAGEKIRFEMSQSVEDLREFLQLVRSSLSQIQKSIQSLQETI